MSVTNNLIGFCSAPWTEGVLTQEGFLRTCCRNGTSFGNWQTEGLQVSWLSPTFIDFRKKILEGKFPDDACKNCYQNGTAKTLVSDMLGLCSAHLNQISKFINPTSAVFYIESLLSVSFPLTEKDSYRFEQFFVALNSVTEKYTDNLVLDNALQKLYVIGRIALSFLSGDLVPQYVAPYRQINLSDICNARCIQCPGLYYGNILKGDSLDEDYLDEAFSNAESIIDFFMNGAEFLAYPSWKKAVERLLAQGVKLSISTNGILLNKNNIHYLIDNKAVSKLNVSMDGACKETVESIRVNVNFDNLCESIKYLFQYATEKDFFFDLSISFVIMKRNFREFPALVRLISSLRGDFPLPAVSVFCQGLEGYDVKGYNELVAQEHHSRIDQEELNNMFQDALNASKETGITVVAFYSTPIEDFVKDGYKYPPMTDTHAELADQLTSQHVDISDYASSEIVSSYSELKLKKHTVSGDFKIYFISNLNEYNKYAELMTSEYLFRENLEYEMAAGQVAFTLPGFCYICDRHVNFSVNVENGRSHNGRLIPNWRESIVCEECNLNNRTRGFIHILEFLTGVDSYTKIYIAEQLSPLYNHLKSKYPLLVGSEFLGNDCSRFVEINGQIVQHQDLTSLTFENDLFDIVLHQDVLEHIPDYLAATRECYRILKPGGYFFFSVPFILNSDKNIIRSRMLPNGCIEHLLPPEYHGNPLDPEGCLAFYHFGWELLEQMKTIGFLEPTTVFYWSHEYGHLGRDQFFFMARK